MKIKFGPAVSGWNFEFRTWNLKLSLIGALFACMSFSQVIAQKSTSNVVFQSGFEEGNKLIWDDYDGNPDSQNQIISDPGPFNTPGNHVIRHAAPSGKRGGSDLVKVLPSQHDSLYVRWYLKYEKGFNFNAPNHGGGFFAGNRNFLGMSDNRPNGNDFATCSIEYNPKSHRSQLYTYSRGMYQDCANPVGSCWGDVLPCTKDEGKTYCKREEDRDPPLPPVLTDDKWYCFELKVNLGKPSADGTEADGEIEFWLDGINYGSWKNRWMRTTADLKLTILNLALFHHDGTHSDAGVLMDDVVVSKSRDIYISALDVKQTGDLLRIYPNPTDKSVKVSFPEYGDYSILLYDTIGRLLIAKSVAGNEGSLDIEKLDYGIYNVVIKDDYSNTVIGSRKLVCR